MLAIKILIYVFIFLICSTIGVLTSKKYTYRVKELMEIKNALNIFKTKIIFTYEPIPEIFMKISETITSNVGNVFKIASNNMKKLTAGEAWSLALDTNVLNLEKEDKNILNNLSTLLGKTNLDGQINQIELTMSFLDKQIIKAEKEREKNEKMYKTLGAIIGMTIVIILM